ncbi:thioredoxin-disulfide reductase [Aerococcus loyolae]|uniref:Thioredoxin reductase n=1 Tax=Aerococcus urinae TaxID=1376 RepID=A0A2I1L645_9LACT|nr:MULTISPECIES: thioredoxin-disulfide reductase [Aerococcus]MCY3067744.1 thioredoxin-disulfide reductase [Aerococcus mictus]MCY3080356.1 thioredoxin-disulfide reductase [Aerococcus mictus]MDK6728029.1 thioredoxin-disulfide reductase [Aerococcus urinae]MDK7909383.1 thioredoxin-disulfide reductase [Aerococcus urinae]MDK8609684.1 thioredoxin-disulfide reductase [Aerococcus urinae]
MSEAIKTYDVIVIGAGPAGLTAALYASRANLAVAVLERGVPGGELINTATVENYPGYKSISGPDLANKMYESAMQFGAEYVFGNVKKVTPGKPYHLIETDNGSFKAKAIVIATGSVHRTLDVPGEEEYNGHGVSYCAVCDGAFYKGRDIKVVGGGDSAVEEGSYLTQFANSVDIIHRRDQLRAQKILQDRAFANDKISFTWDSVVKEIKGDGKQVTSILVENVKTNEVTEVPAGGVFIYVGLLPNSEAFRDLGITDEEGWILTDENMATAVPGIFACGDVRKKKLRQVSTAVGDAGSAGQEAYQYVEALESEIE